MITFLLILVGLVTFNFVLLKFSMQSVNTNKKKAGKNRTEVNHITDQSTEKTKSSEIPTAA